MAGVKGMHKKAQVTKDETLKAEQNGNGREMSYYLTDQNGKVTFPKTDESGHEEKFLSEVLAGYSYWNKQPGNLAKAYAAAYKTLLNEFTAEETEK